MDPRISFVTLGVSDLRRSTAFYTDVLGLALLGASTPEVSFFEMGRTWLALYPRHLLAADAGVSPEGSGFAGFSLAHNVGTAAEVDALLAHVAAASGDRGESRGQSRVVRAGHPADWGGYTGYFADPDGFLWEVAWNPHFPHL